jgi:pyruvate,orthophosphate dikinase
MLANLRKLSRSRARVEAPEEPLLVSLRSGAKFSMPGMMDTILNLGLNDRSVEGLKRWTSNGRFAYDSYRRFIQMFGNVVLEIPKSEFEHEFEAVKKARGARVDTDLDERALGDVVARYKLVRRNRPRSASPRAVADGARRRVPVLEQPARTEYRRIYEIPIHRTAVNVQRWSLALGSGLTGRLTRNPRPARGVCGEF